MEFNFTGKVLTLADLEQAAIEETHEPLSDGARESWNYFGFDRDCEWKAVLTGSEAILVTDENCDLNMAGVYPDTETFIIWLEESHEERWKERTAEATATEQTATEQTATEQSAE